MDYDSVLRVLAQGTATATAQSRPQGAKANQTAAQFNNGVLEVTVPIPEAMAKSQEIPVQEGSK